MKNVFTQILEDAAALRRARQAYRQDIERGKAELPDYTKREILLQKLREIASHAFDKEVPSPRVYPSPFSKDQYRR
jgi:hypothetical protein